MRYALANVQEVQVTQALKDIPFRTTSNSKSQQRLFKAGETSQYSVTALLRMHSVQKEESVMVGVSLSCD